MANKRWTHLKLQNGDKVTFIPPAPNGAQLGGVTQSQRESISQIQPLKSDVEQIESDVEQVKSDVEQVKQDVTQVKDDYLALAKDKISKPADAPAVGKVLKVKQVNEDGTFLCEWADGGSGGGVSDVQVNGTSVVADGVANVPIASTSEKGVAGINTSYGIGIYNGDLTIQPLEKKHIPARNGGNRPVISNVIDESVKYAMSAPIAETAGLVGGVYHYPAWTAEEQLAGRRRMGIDKEWVLKGTITSGTGVTIDLTGCTEIIIYGTTRGTGDSSLQFKPNKNAILGGFVRNGARRLFAYITNVPTGGFLVRDYKYLDGSSYPPGEWVQSNGNGYSFVESVPVHTIEGFTLSAPGNLAECNVKVYAR